MKQKITLCGLVLLSILYLLEIDVSNITVFNWAAFVIIAATFIPLLVSLIRRQIQKKSEDEEDTDS